MEAEYQSRQPYNLKGDWPVANHSYKLSRESHFKRPLLKEASTQTDDTGCNNGCTSIYVNNDILITEKPPLPSRISPLNSHADKILDGNCYSLANNCHYQKDKTPEHLPEVLEFERAHVHLSASERGGTITPHHACSDATPGDSFTEQNIVRDDKEDNLPPSIAYSPSTLVNKDNELAAIGCREESDEEFPVTVELPRDAIHVSVAECSDTTSTSAMSQQLQCYICLADFTSHDGLDEHMTVVHEKPLKCAACEKRFDFQSSLNSHLRSHTGEKPYKCNQCDKSYSQRCHLTDHLRTHSGEKPFKCTFCDKAFRQQSHLRGHLRTHTNERPYKCTLCTKSFQFRSVLNQHIKTHTGQRPFRCTQCNNSFRQAGHLKVHLKTHTGEKPFECTVCNRAFRTKIHLVIHTRTHTGEKPYKCRHCEKSFKSSGDLSSHLRSHTGEKPWDCPYCPKQFATGRSLREHVRLHTGEKPFKCSYCDKAFHRKECLTLHERIHTGNKPFKCSLCDAEFYRKALLKLHTEKKHKNDSRLAVANDT